jgi:hypothetical protein
MDKKHREKIANKLVKLNKQLDDTRGEYLASIARITAVFQELAPDHNIVSNDFPGDGFAIGIEKESNTYQGIESAIEHIRTHGSLTTEDITSL